MTEATRIRNAASAPPRGGPLPRGLASLLGVAALVGLMFFFRETASVFVPFTVALLLALAAYPVVEWLARRRVPRPLSVSLVVLLILVLLAVAVLLIQRGVDSVIGNLPQFKVRATELWTSVSSRLGVTAKLEDMGKEPSAMRTIAGLGGSTALSLVNIAFQLFLVILYLVFLLLGRHSLPRLLRRALGPERERKVLAAIEKIELQMLKYVGLRSAISLLTAAVVWIILMIYGVQFAGLWALLTFFAQFVPFIGPLSLSVLPVLMALLQFPSWSPALWVGGWLTLWHLLVGFILEPKVFSVGLSLNQTLVLLGLALFGWMWGIVGVLLWVPLMFAIRLAAQQASGFQAVDVLLGPADGRGEVSD